MNDVGDAINKGLYKPHAGDVAGKAAGSNVGLKNHVHHEMEDIAAFRVWGAKETEGGFSLYNGMNGQEKRGLFEALHK